MTQSVPNSPKTTLMQGEKRLGWLSGSILLVLVLFFAVIRIEGAVIASGQAEVQGKPRLVQSADGGVVDTIQVADGDLVASGELLVSLDPSLLEVNRDILRARLVEFAARRARLEAEEQGRVTITLEPLIADVEGEIDLKSLESHIAGQQRVFEARRDVLSGQRDQLRERIAQFNRRSDGLSAQIQGSQERIALLDEEIVNLQSLNKRGLAPESRLLELQGRRAAEVAQRATLEADVAANVNAIRDAQLEVVQSERAFREQVTTELREVIIGFEEARLELLKIAQGLERLEIRAPVNGVVHELQVTAAGGVLAPQQTILTVIPLAKGIEFSLEIAPDAVDSVYPGQKARLRFPAFDQKSTPEIWAEVARVSPDSVVDAATGRTFYRVSVTVAEEELARLGGQALVPGMPVEALLQTGSRSILSYLMKPLTDQMVRAFREG